MGVRRVREGGGDVGGIMAISVFSGYDSSQNAYDVHEHIYLNYYLKQQFPIISFFYLLIIIAPADCSLDYIC